MEYNVTKYDVIYLRRMNSGTVLFKWTKLQQLGYPSEQENRKLAQLYSGG